MARPPNYVYGYPVRVQTDRKTTRDHLEEVNCHSKHKKKTTIKACKIRDQVRAHQGKGKLNSRSFESSRSAQSRMSGQKADECNSGTSGDAIPATDNRLDRTRIATNADPALNQLRHFTFHGWPLQKRQLLEPERYYCNNYREEVAIEDGLIFTAHRLVIRILQRAEYLRDLHAEHLGKGKTLPGVRKTVFSRGNNELV